jgi:hypothetical protein
MQISVIMTTNKFYQETHNHFIIARADNGPLHSFSYQVRGARTKEGEYHGKNWKYFLDKSCIEALDKIGFDWTNNQT